MKTKATNKKKCGLCSKSKALMTTDCCKQPICDFEINMKCFRGHNRYTLCSSHYNEQHTGQWQNCNDCKEAFETEMYVYYATNEYNFQKLENPPTYEPTKCHNCHKIIKSGNLGDCEQLKNSKHL